MLGKAINVIVAGCIISTPKYMYILALNTNLFFINNGCVSIN